MSTNPSTPHVTSDPSRSVHFDPPLSPHELRPIPSTAPHAHHIEEFGHVDQIVHMPTRKFSLTAEDEHHDPSSPQPHSTKHKHSKWGKLRRRLFMKRHLMQYFFNDVLYRTKNLRKVTTEELFLDLIIVAAVAALGHELRESKEIVWEQIEKFILLFTAVYISWRGIVVMWNLWGVQQDLAEKITVYLAFISLTGIALGAHSAFDNVGRPYVAVSAFLATAVPNLSGIWNSLKEDLLKNPNNRINQLLLMNSITMSCTVPYLVAAFVTSERTTKILYWIAFGMQTVLLLVPYKIYSYLHRNIPNHTRIAVNIELFVEKFEVLTMIIMGETLIGLLFEGGAALKVEGVRIGFMYLSAVLGTSTLYAIQTLYVQVDSPIPKGGRHAIRHNAIAGFAWSYIHMPFHCFLIMFATGLAISLRDVAVPPHTPAVNGLLRAGASNAESGDAQFTTNARWLYAVGWAGAVICTGLLALLHKAGPRGRTKLPRIIMRFSVAIAVMLGMSFSDLRAEWYQMVFMLVSIWLSVSEFVLVNMEKVGFFRKTSSLHSSAMSSKATEDVTLSRQAEDEADEEDSDSEEQDDEMVEEQAQSEAKLDLERGDANVIELQNRLQRKHCSRLVPVVPAKEKKKLVNNGFG